MNSHIYLNSRSKEDDNDGGGRGRYSNGTANAASTMTATGRRPAPPPSPRIDRKSLQAAAAKGRNKVSAGKFKSEFLDPGLRIN